MVMISIECSEGFSNARKMLAIIEIYAIIRTVQREGGYAKNNGNN